REIVRPPLDFLASRLASIALWRGARARRPRPAPGPPLLPDQAAGARLTKLPLEVAHRTPYALLDLLREGREVRDRRVDLGLELLQLGGAPFELGLPRLGDLVHLPATGGGVGDEPIRLHPGQPGVDRAGRRDVETVEAVLQQADQLVPVLRPV